MSLPPSAHEWRRLLDRGRYPTYEPGPLGHVILAARPGRIQAVCTCGWQGPDRTGDPHAVGLALDDVDWHAHILGAPCAHHQPPHQACLTCEQALADELMTGWENR